MSQHLVSYGLFLLYCTKRNKPTDSLPQESLLKVMAPVIHVDFLYFIIYLTISSCHLLLIYVHFGGPLIQLHSYGPGYGQQRAKVDLGNIFS